MILKDLQVSDKTAPKELLKIFKRAGAEVVQSSVEKAKRQNSISFKTVHLTMSDSQLIDLRVKETGDIYQVLLNGKIIAIKNQDDDKVAVSEIVKAWVANVDKFQAALAKKKTPLPKGVKSTRKKIIETLKTEIAELDALIAEREMQIQAA
ncbi:hypothetical protein JF634_12195 [Simonsiella muelleri]|uniref:Defence against restriction A N-terminal domain-containing protein n=1 Tax=Simonsiella muelleri ATCC 29453 TaxID=641147 RepID=V9HLM2_9NEIS|nr:hypothetical protein [Simonsiella muelleri]AUX61811.1 hypothetical protein BWP33_08350 [Simonsiella muelleri ATCC 29453]EFG30487.2 hypothetical protein HMPREF9021_01774 [Simonsiella muelleri ATCC 29453]UBQ53892.1 hypothetical protein JF634_12195 [Simonsiella muelleri]